jgi:hypothetical protein
VRGEIPNAEVLSCEHAEVLASIVVEISLTGLYPAGEEQSGYQNLGQACEVVDRIKPGLDPLRLDYGKSQRVVKFDLTFLRDEIDRGWKITGIDPGLQEI